MPTKIIIGGNMDGMLTVEDADVRYVANIKSAGGSRSADTAFICHLFWH